MPGDDRRRLRATATRFRSVSRTSAIVVMAISAVALTSFPCVRSSGRTVWTNPPPPLPLAVTVAVNATRDDDDPISRELRGRVRSSTTVDPAGKHGRFPDVQLTPEKRLLAPLYVMTENADTRPDIADVSSPTDRKNVSVDARAYYTNHRIYYEAKPIADNRKMSMTRRQLSNIQTEKNLTPSSQLISIMNDISWRKIGIMALIKLGLVKLKTIGFIKILYFLIFKIKFLLATFFFKFLSLLKFYKVFKFFILPLSLFPLLSTITLSLIPYFLSMINTLVSPASDRLSVPTEIINSVTPQSTVSQSVLVPDDVTVTRPAGQIIVSEVIDPLSEILNAVNSIRYDTSELIDPTLKLFQKELSSEKCIERIACKMATTGKASIIPLWINWVLHRVSKLVPQNQLLYYLKTYVDVTNEIHTNPPNPENWETWCSERYNCNNNYETNDFI